MSHLHRYGHEECAAAASRELDRLHGRHEDLHRNSTPPQQAPVEEAGRRDIPVSDKYFYVGPIGNFRRYDEEAKPHGR